MSDTLKSLGLVAALMGGSVAVAGTGPAMETEEEKAKKMFDAMDTDKDGGLTKAELKAGMLKQYKEKGGGQIPMEEIEKMVDIVITKMFEVVDADKDGKLTFEELKAARAKRGK